MNSWLVKSEPDVYSILDLERDKVSLWDGVRNYQARNYLREMAVGESVFFYHSNGEPTGIAGLAEVSVAAVPDPTQFEKQSAYYDPKSSRELPRWFAPKLRFVFRFPEVLRLETLRGEKALATMVLLKRGSRLSVQPVSKKEYETILSLLNKRSPKRPL